MEAEKIKIAEILIRDYKDKIFINDCPNCGKLARTPKAKQCRYCRHDWRRRFFWLEKFKKSFKIRHLK